MDKNIFMNAIYVKQGEIAKLIDAKPRERKKLIGEILGIEELEKIWEAIREPVRDLESELEGYKRDIEQLSKCEQDLEEKEKELSEKHKKYQVTHTNTNWSDYKFGKCDRCGKLTRLNRFSRCKECYKEVSYNNNLEGDLLYTDAAVSMSVMTEQLEHQLTTLDY